MNGLSSELSPGLVLLEQLRSELQADVGLCTSRDQHIRLSFRLARLDEAIRLLRGGGLPVESVQLNSLT